MDEKQQRQWLGDKVRQTLGRWEDFEHIMQTYSIILGRNSKKSIVDVDLSSLGSGMNISYSNNVHVLQTNSHDLHQNWKQENLFSIDDEKHCQWYKQ